MALKAKRVHFRKEAIDLISLSYNVRPSPQSPSCSEPGNCLNYNKGTNLGELFFSKLRWKSDGAKQTARFMGVI